MAEYIEQRDGGYYVAGTRLSLDSLVYAFRGGESPETIQQQFPSLSFEQVYGAIAYYWAIRRPWMLTFVRVRLATRCFAVREYSVSGGQ